MVIRVRGLHTHAVRKVDLCSDLSLEILIRSVLFNLFALTPHIPVLVNERLAIRQRFPTVIAPLAGHRQVNAYGIFGVINRKLHRFFCTGAGHHNGGGLEPAALKQLCNSLVCRVAHSIIVCVNN